MNSDWIPPVGDTARGALLKTALVACSVAIALLPVAVRSSFETTGEQAAFERRFPAIRIPVFSQDEVPAGRDPFSGPGDMAPVVGVPFQVRGIVSGENPRAIVLSAGHVRIVGVGDTIAGARIVSIDAMGVHLHDGRIVRVSGSER